MCGEMKYQDEIIQTRKELDITFEVVRNCLVIGLNKELDHHSAVYLKEKSEQMLNRNNIKNIIFDFSRANFMDSSGIGVIMGRYKRVIFSGGKVAVSGVGDAVNRIFTISGLYKIIERYETVEDAIKGL